MDKFALKTALADLDAPVPDYFKTEIFAHGDLTVPRLAQQVLMSLGCDDDPSDRFSVDILCEMLRVVPADEE